MRQSAKPRTWVITAQQRQRAWPFLIAAAGSVVAGGLISAMSGPLGWQHGPWAAAYLVLVGGVAQAVLIVGRLVLTPEGSEHTGWIGSAIWPYCGLWNLATLLVIGGTLASSFALVLIGSFGLLTVLAVFWPTRVPKVGAQRGWHVSYQLFLVFMALSTGVGCVLALR